MLKQVQHDSNIHDVTLNSFQGLSNFKTTQKNKQEGRLGILAQHDGFTLAEVLITLVIIGIVAAISVPVMINTSKWKEYKSGAYKAKSILDNALKMYQVKEGEIPLCAYWEKNPYGPSKCISYAENGGCLKYELENGAPFPSDYNGPNNDCLKVLNFLHKNLNVAKYCDNDAYSNGCIPHYDGIDKIEKNKYPDKTDQEILKSVSGLGKWTTNNLKKNQAIVTTDGMIFIPYGSTPILLLVDINGQKGPNKFGHDLISFRAKVRNKYSVPKYEPHLSVFDKGGKTTQKLMYGKEN